MRLNNFIVPIAGERYIMRTIILIIRSDCMKKITLILLPLLASTAYANPTAKMTYGMNQNVQVCISVAGTENADGFKAGFVSSDLFNRTRWTNNIVNGSDCKTHTYHHGPKNIKVKVEGKNYKSSYVKVNPDASCSFLG